MNGSNARRERVQELEHVATGLRYRARDDCAVAHHGSLDTPARKCAVFRLRSAPTGTNIEWAVSSTRHLLSERRQERPAEAGPRAPVPRRRDSHAQARWASRVDAAGVHPPGLRRRRARRRPPICSAPFSYYSLVSWAILYLWFDKTRLRLGTLFLSLDVLRSSSRSISRARTRAGCSSCCSSAPRIRRTRISSGRSASRCCPSPPTRCCWASSHSSSTARSRGRRRSSSW